MIRVWYFAIESVSSTRLRVIQYREKRPTKMNFIWKYFIGFTRNFYPKSMKEYVQNGIDTATTSVNLYRNRNGGISNRLYLP